jgi:hypothetical protein
MSESSAASNLGDYRWSGYSLAQKQDWMRNGQGSSAVVPGMDFLDSLASTFDESEDHLRGALAELGVHWSGSGASAACESLRTVLDWANGLRITASGAGAGLGKYGDSFAQVKLKIPGLLEINVQAAPGGDLAMVNGLQGDLRAGPVAASRADQVANVALTAHERTTRDALASLLASRAGGAEGELASRADGRAGTRPSAAGATPTSTAASDGPDQDDGHRHDEGAFGALPIMPPTMGTGGSYRSIPPRPGRLVDPADEPFRPLGPGDGTEPGGVLPPREPITKNTEGELASRAGGAEGECASRADGTGPAPRVTACEPEPRFPTEWTALPRQATPVPGQRLHPYFADIPEHPPAAGPAARVEPLPPPVDRPLPPLGGATAARWNAQTGPGGINEFGAPGPNAAPPLAGLAARLGSPLRGLRRRAGTAAQPEGELASRADGARGELASRADGAKYLDDELPTAEPEPEPVEPEAIAVARPEPTAVPRLSPAATEARPRPSPYPRQAEYGYPAPRHVIPTHIPTYLSTDHDPEFDAEFDRELGMNFDERTGVPPVLGLPRRPVAPEHPEDRW